MIIVKESLGYLLYKFEDNDKPIVVQKVIVEGSVIMEEYFVKVINNDYGNLGPFYKYEKVFEIKHLGYNINEIKEQYSMYFI